MAKILMKGNEALSEAAIRAGCRHFFGYPITPQNEVNAYLSAHLPKVGGVYLQAESEIASINMVIGAASAGVRAMTSSSSPGISLKTEGISYLAACDLPCLIVNVQRGGPGLGGIQPAQSDYHQATKAPGHGDFRILVFTPSTVQESADLVFTAFDLSERYRIPAMILSDGLLGQMMEPVEFPDIDVKTYDKPWATTGRGGGRIARGAVRAQNVISSLCLESDELERTVVERFARYAEIEKNHSMCEEYLTDDADVLVVAYGASSRVVRSAVNAARDNGIKAGLLRPITVWPFPEQQLLNRIKTAKCVLVVEMSMGQMLLDVQLIVQGRKSVRFFGRTGGVVPTPDEVLGQIKLVNGGVA